MYGMDLQKGERPQPKHHLTTSPLTLDYKSLKGLQKAVKCHQLKVKDFNQTPSDYKSIDLDYKSPQRLQKAVKRSGMYGMDLQKGKRLQPIHHLTTNPLTWTTNY
jgi:hypothetical protein